MYCYYLPTDKAALSPAISVRTQPGERETMSKCLGSFLYSLANTLVKAIIPALETE
jgi:hypothetical protein